jgi:hypothetical protein
VEIGLSLLPSLLVATGIGGLDLKTFDLSKMPNAKIVSARLFPGTTVFYDDGDAWRWESHYSIWVPSYWSLLPACFMAEMADSIGVPWDDLPGGVWRVLGTTRRAAPAAPAPFVAQ